MKDLAPLGARNLNLEREHFPGLKRGQAASDLSEEVMTLKAWDWF